MDYRMLSLFLWITVICSLSGANADCASDLAQTDAYIQCFGQFGMWAADRFGAGGGANGGSGSDGPPDVGALMCTPDAKSKIGCFFKYMVQCPAILASLGGAAALFPVDLSTLTGDNPIETICATTSVACSTWMSCFSETDPSQMTVDPGVPAQTYVMVPAHYKTFISMVYMVCGNLKPLVDCAITKLEEGGCPMEPFDAMAKAMMQEQVKTMTYEENKMFMKDDCPAVTDAFKTCVGTALAKPEFKECYKSATDMYKTKAWSSCAMYSANKDCLLRTVQSDCGKTAAMWLIKHSPKIVDSGLPTDCLDTSGTNDVPNLPRHRLIKGLMARYNKLLAPEGPSGTALNVSHFITINRLISLEKYKNVLTIDATISLKWMDHQLSWNPCHYDNVRSIKLPSKLLWQPDIMLVTNADPKNGYANGDLNAVVWYNGEVSFHQPVGPLRSYCKNSIRPTDSTTCDLKFTSWTNDGNTLNLQFEHDNGDIVIDNMDKEFNKYITIESVLLSRNEKMYDGCHEGYNIELVYSLFFNADPKNGYANGHLNAVVWYNGEVSFHQPVGPLRSYCKNSIRPTDSTTCDLKFTSWTNDGNTLNFQFEHDNGDIVIDNMDKEFNKYITIESVLLSRNEKMYDGCHEGYNIDLVYRLLFK